MKKNFFYLSFRVLFIAMLLFTIAGNKASAQSKVDCSKAKSQPEIDACAQKELDEADKELNTIYKKVSAKLDGAQKQCLVQSQRQWIIFRDSYSKIYGLIYSGGSIAPSAIMSCKTQTTRARIAELKTLLGDVDL